MILPPPVLPLLKSATATGDRFSWPGGQGRFVATASAWNGATISLQFVGPDGATLLAVSAATTFTQNGNGVFLLEPCIIQAVVSGAVPTAAYASAGMIPSWVIGSTY